MANKIIVSMGMVCNPILYPHGSGKSHSHCSFAIAIDGQHSYHHMRVRKTKIVLCKHVSNLHYSCKPMSKLWKTNINQHSNIHICSLS
jgi:hypothetical protein